MTAPRPRDVVAFQLKHIGDVVLTLPALGLVKKYWPEVRTGLVAKPGPASLARRHPWVDELFVYGYDSGRPGGAWSAVRELRRRKFHTAFIFDAKNRSSFTARAAGCREVVGATAMGRLWGWPKSLLYTRQLTGPWSPADSLAYRYQQATAEVLGLAADPALYPLAPPLDQATVAAARKLTAELPGRGPRIGLAVSGLWPGKLWPLEYFAEVARRLHQRCGARVFVTGAADEAPLAARVRALAGTPVADFCGRTSLPELLALAADSELFITIDTGTAHVAALAGIPQIAIFVATQVAIWAPRNPRARLLCYDKLFDQCGAPRTGPWQIAPEVTPDLVLKNAFDMLNL